MLRITATVIGMVVVVMIDWFNAYPSRAYAIVMYLLLVTYALLLAKLRNVSNKQNKKRFVYCDGKKSNVIWVDMVSREVFDNYDSYVGYGIIDRNNQSIYFNVH